MGRLTIDNCCYAIVNPRLCIPPSKDTLNDGMMALPEILTYTRAEIGGIFVCVCWINSATLLGVPGLVMKGTWSGGV